jgi:hypothetical protein
MPKLRKTRVASPGGRLSHGTCARCKITGARLVASRVLEAEVCTRCLVAGASGQGWLRESDLHVLRSAGESGDNGGRA